MMSLKKAWCTNIANNEINFLLNDLNQNVLTQVYWPPNLFTVTHRGCMELQARCEAVFEKQDGKNEAFLELGRNSRKSILI